MASEKNINSWYENFIKDMSGRKMEIDIFNPQDATRIRVPAQDKKATVPLFPNGFTDTPANRKMLYSAAENNQLFAFSKVDEYPYMMELGIKAKDGTVKCKAQGVRDAKRAKPPKEPGVLYNILNILTLGILEQNEGRQKEYERAQAEFEDIFDLKHVGYTARFLNRISRGLIYGDRCGAYDRALGQCEQLSEMREVISSEHEERTEKLIKEQEEKVRRTNEERRRPKADLAKGEAEKIKGIKEVRNQQDDGLGQNIEDPKAKSQMFKSQMSEQYEKMLNAFGPNKGNWETVVASATNIQNMLDEMKKDPKFMEQANISEKYMQHISNICTTMAKIGENGLTAKAVLMDKKLSKDLPPQEREACILNMQKMNVMENSLTALANHADKPDSVQVRKKIDKMMENIGKDPKFFERGMENMVDSLQTTKEMRNMTPEKLSVYAGEKGPLMSKLRKEVSEKAEQSIMQEEQKQLQQQKQMQQNPQQMQQQMQPPQQQPLQPQYP